MDKHTNETDIAVTTRVRLARNIKNIPYPRKTVQRKFIKVGTNCSQSASQCPPPIWQCIFTAEPEFRI